MVALGGGEGDGDLGDGILVLTPIRSDLVVQSSLFFWPNPRREIYNLSMVSGPVLKKIKGESQIFILLRVNKRKQNGNMKRDRSNFGPWSSR